MFTIKEILDCTGARLISGSPKREISGVSLDSRSIRENELFVALKGSRFDGHAFIEQARSQGAGAILFSDKAALIPSLKSSNSLPILRVKDTVLALGALAHRYRMRFKIPVVAVTGSNGKTTTKEMLSCILGRRFNVLRNLGTENNHIGVPLTLLNLSQEHSCAVIEIGANHPGEIDRLSWMIQPSVGVITNIGPAHLKFFKSLKGVFAAKLELMRNLSKGAKLVINQDDQFLSQLNNKKFKTITFGLNRRSEFSAQIIRQVEGKTQILVNKKYQITLSTSGRHNVYNALASIATARSFGISYREIKDALASFKAPPMRMQILDLNDIKIINDCYNSNPGSLRWALQFLRDYSTQGKKIVVCGDMLELGRRAEKLHSDIGKRIARGKLDFLITVGSLSKNIASGAYSAGMSKRLIRTYHDTAEAAKFLRKITGSGDIVLIKGSRAMQMENVIECFTNFSIH